MTLILVFALAAFTGSAFYFVRETTRTWHENDVALRARLALRGARRALIEKWHVAYQVELSDELHEITRDERIMAAAACAADLTTLAETRGYPSGFSCATLARYVRDQNADAQAPWHAWFGVFRLPGGNIHVSAIPLFDNTALGFVVLIHDLSYVQRREAQTLRFLFAGFVLLALALALTMFATTRSALKRWTAELRQAIRGDSRKPQYLPILRDVRELVERISSEESRDKALAWTPQRLKQTLARYLHGEKIVIVANRAPYIHQKSNGQVTVLHPASGLVTALEPIMRACSGVWIAHGSGTADKLVSDAQGRVAVPPGAKTFFIRNVWLSTEEEQGYYYGFANEGLWPLCHIAHTRPVFRQEDWDFYRQVNEKFVDAVCAEVDVEDPVILVQDYHFALAPKLIRQRLPNATVITFWHVPWPNSERFGICPWRQELLEGLLGSSIIGFHIQSHCNNFIDSVERFLEARIDKEQSAVVQQGRHTLVRSYPISIEWPSRWLQTTPSVEQCRDQVIQELGLAPDALIGLGADRVDYTKGIEERFLSVEKLLESNPEYRNRLVWIQLAAPSRTVIETYRLLNERIERLAERINRRFGKNAYRPIILLHSHHEPQRLMLFYRAAHVCYVSSLHDGMNLVAKEFVGARSDEQGVLILSEFTGAARELAGALIVNPYDITQAASAIAAALEMSEAEQRDRMRAMRAYLSEFTVYRWAGSMLLDAARLRQRDRLYSRLSEVPGAPQPRAAQ